jgi:deoxycytidylate deaminase
MKLIIQAGITHIRYLSDGNQDREYYIASKKMADAAGIEYHKITPTKNSLIIDFANYKNADKSE